MATVGIIEKRVKNYQESLLVSSFFPVMCRVIDLISYNSILATTFYHSVIT